MQDNHEISVPVYRKIAIDLARNIAMGKYNKGQKLSGRSVLASHYKASPETVRKAVSILKDVGILETEKGSGIEIVSIERAFEFVERYEEIDNIVLLKSEITQWAQTQTKQTEKMMERIQQIVSAIERLSTVSPLNPYQIKITSGCKVLGKTLGELQFWHNTGGTVIAMRHGEDLIVSPGPYASFCEGDTVFIVGDPVAYSATLKFIFG